jgi:hypothetical protein
LGIDAAPVFKTSFGYMVVLPSQEIAEISKITFAFYYKPEKEINDGMILAAAGQNRHGLLQL